MKTCSRCGAEKEESEFRRGRQCRDCKRQYNRDYYAANSENAREYQRKYQRAYREANLEKVRESNRAYREANSEKRREQTHRHRARQQGRIR